MSILQSDGNQRTLKDWAFLSIIIGVVLLFPPVCKVFPPRWTEKIIGGDRFKAGYEPAGRSERRFVPVLFLEKDERILIMDWLIELLVCFAVWSGYLALTVPRKAMLFPFYGERKKPISISEVMLLIFGVQVSILFGIWIHWQIRASSLEKQAVAKVNEIVRNIDAGLQSLGYDSKRSINNLGNLQDVQTHFSKAVPVCIELIDLEQQLGRNVFPIGTTTIHNTIVDALVNLHELSNVKHSVLSSEEGRYLVNFMINVDFVAIDIGRKVPFPEYIRHSPTN